jgi:hypothetical protein
MSPASQPGISSTQTGTGGCLFRSRTVSFHRIHPGWSGKTASLVEVAQNHPQDTAWYSLEDTENEPTS